MKPSEIKTLKAKKAHFLLPHFQGITWMGIVYCQREKDIEDINATDKINSNFKSHETIHVRQAQSMGNSWLRFYLNYVWQYIKNLPLIFIDLYAPYKLIPTEIEAYLHQDDWTYAEEALPLTQWRAFQTILSYKDKKEIAINYARKHKLYPRVLKEYFRDYTDASS